MADLAFVLLLTVWAEALGCGILRRVGMRPADPLERFGLGVPLGLGALSLAVLGLGEAGCLTRTGLVGVGLIGAVFGFHHPARLAPAGVCARTGRPARTWLDLAFAGLLATALLGTLLTALAPVTDGDALCYHLQVPKVFLARHAACFDPDLHETVYPLLTELVYAVALAFRGPVACRLVEWVFGLVFGANVVLLARPVLGPRAWWAGTLALLVPAISNGMSAPLNDVALAAFGTAAIVAFLRYSDQPDDARVLLAGTFAGLALGVKYPALVLTTLLAMAIAAREPRRARPVVLFCLTTLLVGNWWYLRAAIATGNPVYPFFRHAFGGAGLDEVLDPIKRPLATTGWNLLTALVPMTLEPDRFDSFSHQFGPVFLLFLPALLLERPPRRAWGLALLGYTFLTICLTQRQSMRFVLLALGPLSAAAAWVVHAWSQRRSVPARALVGLLLLVLAFETGLAAMRVRHGLGVLTGRESADHYLARREPTYRVGGWVGRHLPPGARLIGQDHRGYYFPRPYTMELAHRRRTGLGRHGESAGETVVHLRAAGFTHVLLCPPVPEDAVEFDPTLGWLLAPWLEKREAIYRADLADADGVVRRYALYALDEGEAVAQSEPRERGRR